VEPAFRPDDQGSTKLSLVLVFLVLVYVYPLKILFGSFFAWISGGWLPQVAEIHTLADLQGMFAMYGLAFGSLSLLMAALNRHALREVVTPPLSAFERERTRGEIVRWLYSALVAAGSIVFAMLLSERGRTGCSACPGCSTACSGFTGRSWIASRRSAPPPPPEVHRRLRAAG
jgi:hypothetical protein